MKRLADDASLEKGHTKLDNIPNQVERLGDDRSWLITAFLPFTPTIEEMKELWAMKPGERTEIMIMGKKVKVPRFDQSFGQAYRFSGSLHPAKPIPPLIGRFLFFANDCCATLLKRDYRARVFNAVFLNWYDDGEHYIGWHSDDETQLFKNERGETLVFSISLGQERLFKIRSKSSKETKEVKLANKSCLLMGGLCQTNYKHCVPKQKRVTRGRINLTFRIFK